MHRTIKSVLLVMITILGSVLGSVVVAPPASAAASIASVSFGGGTSVTTAQGTTYYFQSGKAQSVFVSTSADTKCVVISGAFTARDTSSTGKSSWFFSTTTPAGEGTKSITVAASVNFNANNCTGQSVSTSASYVLDNTGPVVTPNLSPAANADGWNKDNTTLSWSTSDPGGIGVDPNTRPAAETFSSNGVTPRSVTVKDYLGNSTTASTTVRVDKAAPTISATQTSGGFGQPTTVTFTCADSSSGGVEQSGIASCLAGGSTTNSKTITGNGTVTGAATDRAGNTKTLAVEVRNVDTTAPVLSGSPTTSPNGNGWYAGDVTVRWTASDPESGIPTPPADTTITGEGLGLTSSRSVTNGAGLSTTATSSPAVRIDRTAPVTTLTGGSNEWTNGAVTLSLAATDNLSGVDKTLYSVDGGATQTGTTVSLATEGEHTVAYHSVDRAGNAEAVRTVHAKIDRTAPTISHHFTPTGYTDGTWTNGPVTVTFDCADQGGSGIASCTGPATRSAEGEHDVAGTATDGAGNAATDHASVLIDLTKPTVTASVTGDKNDAGWYRDDVTVSYSCSDALSGVASCSHSETLGQGAGQAASGSATDNAGNTGSGGVSGIDVDKTAPVLTASYSTAWSTGDVTVDWTCTDALSGPVGPSQTQTTVGGEGDNLSATQYCTDKAGNVASKTVSGIRIDRHPPVTRASVPDAPASGWYTGPVQVTLDGSDNLSGVTTTTYAVDGGQARSYDGAFTVEGDGVHTISFHSTDAAGNQEAAGAPLRIKIDGTAPTTKVINPIVPDSGWFVTSGIPFAFDAGDGTDSSGIKATYYVIDGGPVQIYGEPFTGDLSTGKHTVTYWSVDQAGNKEADQTLELAVDTIAPTIIGTRTPAANAFGWNKTDVDVTFECSDADSGLDGVVGCGPIQKVSSEGANQKVQGDAQDIAGNKSATMISDINIDKTAPSLVGATTTAANGAGWYNGDVQVAWTGEDGLSGIDPATQPANSTITGEGSSLGASASISDKAGNTKSASVSGVRIDRTAPVVAGKATTAVNAAGWYRDSVTVDFTCTDNLSGVAYCPTSKVLSGNGANQSVTSDPARDRADNESAGKTVGGINIDGTAPTTTSNNQCTKTSGWCTGSTANVVLASADQAGLSGVKEIRYQIDGGTVQVAAGASKTVSVPLDGSGAGTVSYWAVDNAGNVETKNTVALKWDNIAPTVTHTLAPAPNALDWNKEDVTVTFNAKDDDAGSGVATVTAPVKVSTETAGQVVNGSATDTAGNIGTDTVTVKLDKTAPSITGAITAGTKGSNGWYTGPVTVTFTCSDGLSGVQTCPDPVVLTDNGANSASGTATDKAGNSASATVSGINIDKTAPVISDVSVAGGFYTLGAVPKATCVATDTFSGLAGDCSVTVTGGTANGVGTFTWTATAIDNAGNKTAQTGTYKVVYKFNGFLQPINDTAHQSGLTTSVFKAGSTIPVKFQLRNAAGQPLQSATAPVWLTPVLGAKMSMPVDETAVTVSADSGSTFRYDATAQQYLYNWKTPSTGGNYYQIGVRLDDGQIYYVNVGLR